MKIETLPAKHPPRKPPRIATGFAGDETEDLAERIVALPRHAVGQLANFVSDRLANPRTR